MKQLRSLSGQEMFQRIRDANVYKVCDVEHEVPLAAVPAMLRHEENLEQLKTYRCLIPDGAS